MTTTADYAAAADAVADAEIYQDRLTTVASHAWEIWTGNGRGLDAADCEQTGKQAVDAAANTWEEGLTDLVWLDRTVARLGGAGNA